MSLIIERARSRKRVTWITVVGIVLLPVLIGGVLVGALWNPTEGLDNITAAIVNNDDPVTIDGQLAPLGRQLAAGLVEGSDDLGSNIDWVISNTDDASSGLADGTYQAAITIPQDFSAAATSTGTDDPEQATIDVRTAPDAKVFDEIITSQIASIAASTIGRSLSQVYIENVLEGFTTLNDQLGDASDGAEQLADGANAAAEGTTSLVDGASQLAEGAASAADGTGTLASGAADLATGADGLASGAADLATGADGVSSGATQLSDGLGQLAPGASSLADGTAGLAAGTDALVSGVTELSTGLDALAAGADTAVSGVQAFEDQVRDQAATTAASQLVPQELLDNAAAAASGTQNLAVTLAGTDPSAPAGLVGTLGALAAQCDATVSGDEFCATLAAAAATAGDAASQAGTAAVAAGTASAYADGLNTALPEQTAAGLTQIADGLAALRVGEDGTSGLTALSTGLSQAATSVSDPAQGLLAGVTSLADGAHQLDDGAGSLSAGLTQVGTEAASLATGAAQLADGTDTLATGAGTLANGTTSLADGASQLAAGSAQLATGTSDLADGAADLGDGMTTLAEGTANLADGLTSAVDKIPSYTEAQRTSIASVVSEPVTTNADASSLSFGGAAVPLLVILALWFGGLGSYIAIQSVSRRALASRAPSFLLTLKSFLPGAAIGAAQGVLLSVIVQFATKYDVGQWFAFAGLAALAGIAFAAVNQALVAVFGGTGRWISAIVGVLFFATGVVSTTPGFLTGIADLLPTAPAFRSLLTVVTTAAGAGAAVTALVVWTLGALLATTLIVVRRRSTTAKVLQTA